MATSIFAYIARPFLIALAVVPALGASGQVQSGENGQVGPATSNIIPNGDFSLGNVGFRSQMTYAKPEFNCLWPMGYTIAETFNKPLLHKLVAPEAFPSAVRHTGKEKVFFANAGGTDDLIVWEADVKCKPNTQYQISFNCISFSGHIEWGDPPRQIATEEWVPDFEIWADGQVSAPFRPGLAKYYKAKMFWDSANRTSATIKIVRNKIPHGGGLIGISNIEMIPVKSTAK